MTSPYPLPEGCIFREDFINPKLAADNGLVNVGTGPVWIPGGGVTLAANATLQKTGRIVSTPSFTLIADVIVGPATGQYKTVITQGQSGFNEFNAGFNNSNTSLFWSTSITGVSSSPVPVGRRLVAWSYTGGTASFYCDGIGIGSFAAAVIRRPSLVSMLGAWHGGGLSLLYPLLEFRAYNYAMTADEIRQVTLRIRGLKS